MRKPLSPKDRFTVLSRDGFRCRYCGHSAPNVELQVDHVIAVSIGGENELHNYVTACHKCNIGKSNRLLSQSALAKLRPDLLRVTAGPLPLDEFLSILAPGVRFSVIESMELSDYLNAETPWERQRREAEVDAWEAELRDIAAYYSDNDDYSQWEECR